MCVCVHSFVTNEPHCEECVGCKLAFEEGEMTRGLLVEPSQRQPRGPQGPGSYRRY